MWSNLFSDKFAGCYFSYSSCLSGKATLWCDSSACRCIFIQIKRLAQLGERGVTQHHNQKFPEREQTIWLKVHSSLASNGHKSHSSCIFFTGSPSDFLSVFPRVLKESLAWWRCSLKVTAAKRFCFRENDTASHHFFLVNLARHASPFKRKTSTQLSMKM